MKSANNAPTYACMYAELAEISRKHGYALCPHGSLARDFDLVCIPWIKEPSTPQEVVEAMCEYFALTTVGEPEEKEHKRLVYTLTLGFGETFLDLSFMPTF